ncbi:hypothetical protein [Streptomyces sp. NPDC056468]|uniref:hypothetical protein n=1 Tax=Streptomyces sp. NPDC056468 TaxID=3345830 RepID=UPI00368FFF51
MDQGLAAVLGAVVGVAGAIAATMLAGLHQSNAERGHWRRQSRRDTYGAFATAAERAYDCAIEAERLLEAVPPDLNLAKSKIENMRTHVDEADRLSTIIALEGPRKVEEVCSELNETMESWVEGMEAWHRAADAQNDTSQVHQAAIQHKENGADQFTEFINSAIKALK